MQVYPSQALWNICRGAAIQHCVLMGVREYAGGIVRALQLPIVYY